MPRFHFNLLGGKDVSDPEGVELPDLPAARAYAATYLADTIKDDPAEPWTAGEMKVEVTDDRGLVICALTVISQDAPASGSFGAKPTKG